MLLLLLYIISDVQEIMFQIMFLLLFTWLIQKCNKKGSVEESSVELTDLWWSGKHKEMDLEV